MRMRVMAAVALVAGLALGVSCSRTEKPAQKQDELTPLNAAEKYGGVMGGALRRAKEMDLIMPIQHSIRSFRSTEGRNPSSLQELEDSGYELPKPPEGKKFVYDAQSGTVRLE